MKITFTSGKYFQSAHQKKDVNFIGKTNVLQKKSKFPNLYPHPNRNSHSNESNKFYKTIPPLSLYARILSFCSNLCPGWQNRDYQMAGW